MSLNEVIDWVLPSRKALPNLTIGIAAASMTLASVITSISTFAIQRVTTESRELRAGAVRLEVVRHIPVVFCCLIAAGGLFVNAVMIFMSVLVFGDDSGRIVPIEIAILCFCVTLISYSLGRNLVYSSIESVRSSRIYLEEDVPLFPLIEWAGTRSSITVYGMTATILFIGGIALTVIGWMLVGKDFATLMGFFVISPTILSIITVYLLMNAFGFYSISDRISRTRTVIVLVWNDSGEYLLRRPMERDRRKLSVRRMLRSERAEVWGGWWMIPRYDYHIAVRREEDAIKQALSFVRKRIGAEVVPVLDDQGEKLSRPLYLKANDEKMAQYLDSLTMDGSDGIMAIFCRAPKGAGQNTPPGYSWVKREAIHLCDPLPEHIQEIFEIAQGGGKGASQYWSAPPSTFDMDVVSS